MNDTETKLIERLREWYLGASSPDANKGWRGRAVKARGFYTGKDQWPEGAEQLLEAQGRPALTINRILPIVNVITGQQLKNPTELRLYARKRSTKPLADLGSSLIKHAMESCAGYDAVSDCYRDGVITGKGWVTIDQVYDKDPVTGDLMVLAPDPLALYEDPRNTHYDINHGEFVFGETFATKAKLKAHYPTQYDDAIAAMDDDWFGRADLAAGGNPNIQQFYNLLCGPGGSAYSNDGELAGVIMRACWYKTIERVKMILVRVGRMMITANVNGDEDERKLRAITDSNPDLEVEQYETVVTKLNLCVMVGDVVLKREEDPLHGMSAFPYVRYCPYWDHGDPFGVVENLEGPQEEHNKQRSNALHQMNVAGNPGWEGGHPTEEGLLTIKNFGSTPGVYIDNTQFGGKINRIQTAPLNAGLMELAGVSSDDIREISGANPDVTGTNENTNESGRARLIRVEAGQTTLAPIVGNLQRTQATVADTIWDFIRHSNVYSPEEIEMIVDEDTLAAIGGLQGAVEAMNSWDVGTYGVKTGSTKTSLTWRDAQLAELQETAALVGAMGLQLPPNVANAMLAQVMESSTLPGADKIADLLKQQPAQPIPAVLPPSPSGKSTPARSMATQGGGRR